MLPEPYGHLARQCRIVALDSITPFPFGLRRVPPLVLLVSLIHVVSTGRRSDDTALSTSVTSASICASRFSKRSVAADSAARHDPLNRTTPSRT